MLGEAVHCDSRGAREHSELPVQEGLCSLILGGYSKVALIMLSTTKASVINIKTFSGTLIWVVLCV